MRDEELSADVVKLLEAEYDDGRVDAFQDMAYHLPRLVKDLNPNAACPQCFNTIGSGRACDLCVTARGMFRNA